MPQSLKIFHDPILDEDVTNQFDFFGGTVVFPSFLDLGDWTDEMENVYDMGDWARDN